MIRLIVFVGLGAAIIAYIFIQRINKKKQQELNAIMDRQFDLFKKNAVKIKVDLSKAKLKSNNWSEEVVIDNSKYGGLNQLAGQGHRNIKTVQHNENVLIFNIPYNESTINVTYNISIDTKTLEMKLALQKETFLYVNPNNSKEYYLDLEFI